MNLVIDIGNTSMKAALFNENHLEEHFFIDSYPELFDLIKKHNNPILFSNVREKELSNEILRLKKDVYELSLSLKLPIEIDYNTPLTLGIDRIAASCGAIFITDAPCLIVDIGTCITLDVITEHKKFLGGNISPGPELRFKSMNNFTASLPLEDLNNESKLIGRSTQEALQSGVKNGIIYEIQGMFNELKKQDHKYQLVLTGGHCNFFDSKLKEDIFAEPNLVLIGLNRILNYNVKK